MALNKAVLKADIILLMTEMLTKEDNSIDAFAEKMSSAIEKFVKSGTVNVTVTTTVATAGSATAQTGTGSGTGTGTIS